MEAEQAAAEAAAVNGDASARGIKNPLTVVKTKGILAATELGFGFISAAVAVSAGTYSVNRFVAAYRIIAKP